jgi:hypothetical protein
MPFRSQGQSELKLELIQTKTAQTPMLRAEVQPRALRESKLQDMV